MLQQLKSGLTIGLGIQTELLLQQLLPDNISNPLTANVVTLDAGDSITLTVVVTTSTVPTDTVITNTAQAVANGLTVVTSPAVTHVITATPPVLIPSLAITKTATPNNGSIVERGNFITYTITVQGEGGPVEIPPTHVPEPDSPTPEPGQPTSEPSQPGGPTATPVTDIGSAGAVLSSTLCIGAIVVAGVIATGLVLIGAVLLRRGR